LSRVLVFAILYLVFLIILEVRLNKWNEEEPGKCYNWHLTTSPHARHPNAEKTYVAVTGVWMLVSVFSAVFASVKKLDKKVKSVLALGLLQFPVHVYMLITLRIANQGLLEGGEQENEWGFGQIVALVLLSDTIISAVNGLIG
jgi:hypothetical protein